MNRVLWYYVVLMQTLSPHHSVKTWEVYNRAEKAWQKESALRCRQLDEIQRHPFSWRSGSHFS